MPFSSESGKWATDRALSRIVPHLRAKQKGSSFSVLDIGAGSGTYSKRYRPGVLGNAQWTGIEVWAPYIEKYALSSLYDSVVQEDARLYTARLFEARSFDNATPFDLVFLGDVVEHMSKEDAMKMVDQLLAISQAIIISIPVVHYPQGEYDGNPFEEHVKDDWSDEEVRSTWGHAIVQGFVENEIGVYVLSSKEATACELDNLLSPTIGVYAISKNEEQLIGRWAEKLQHAMSKNYVQQAVLFDTGSTDETVEIAQNVCRGLKIIRGLVSPWRFDEGKNTALALLPDVDIAVSVDIDEYVPMGSWVALLTHLENSLRITGRLPDRIHHSFRTVWDWEQLEAEGKKDDQSTNSSQHYHDRLHSRANWLWALPVHEILEWKATALDYEKDPRIDFLASFWMIQKPVTKDSRPKYMALLEESVKERPDVWKSWSFLAQEYLNAGRNDDALAAAESAEKQDGADLGFLAYLKSFIYYDPHVALRSIIKAAEIDGIREYHVLAAEKAFQLGLLDVARVRLNRAKEARIQTQGYKLNMELWSDAGDRYLQALEDRLCAAEPKMNYRPAAAAAAAEPVVFDTPAIVGSNSVSTPTK